MSNDLPLLKRLTENSTEAAVSANGWGEYYVLLVVLSVFAGGVLVLLSLLVLFCHTCCTGGRRFSRASEDLEKTNTSYVEDTQPTHEIVIRLDEADALAPSSGQQGETERFVGTCSTGRRVSFNESALYDQERTEDKGRRYTLTEGDFHHLKKARLTHLQPAPVRPTMKIHTITECESTEGSATNLNELPGDRNPLTIYQPSERGEAHGWVGQSLSGGLPGDPHHSVVFEQGSRQIPPSSELQHTLSLTLEAMWDRGDEDIKRGPRDEWEASPAQTSVLQFLSKLRRHASLEGAGPYFKKWKFESSHRAASLDAKGSPKRRPFQRQRAASETMDHTEEDLSSLAGDLTPPLQVPQLHSSGLQSLSAGSLTQTSTPSSSTAFFDRLEAETRVELEVGDNITGRNIDSPLPYNHYAQWQESSTGDGAEGGSVLETETGMEAMFAGASRGAETEAQLAAGAEIEDDEEDESDELGIKGNINTTSRSNTVTRVHSCDVTAHVRTNQRLEEEEGAEEVLGAEAWGRADSGSSLSFLLIQDSAEPPHSLYRDIWSLRASLEQYANSDHSSTDRESIRSDADSLSSAGGRHGLEGCLSQDLGDEPDADGEGEAFEHASRGVLSGVAEATSGAGGDGEGGNRKLLQMDSGYASIEAPSRAPEDLRLFGMPGGSRGKTASERRLFFTSSRRKGSVCDSFEANLLQEEQEDEMSGHTDVDRKQTAAVTASSLSFPIRQNSQLGKATFSQNPLECLHLLSKPTSPLVKPRYSIIPQPSPAHRPRLRRRDYSIDEKTDALFREFLRHDPSFDQQDSPQRARHRSRVHLRKQWQRYKQYSDPGSSTGGRYSPSLERQRFTPLRRGDSVGYPLDTRYHSTLSRIASAADEEASEGVVCEGGAQEGLEENQAVPRGPHEVGESVSEAASGDEELSSAGGPLASAWPLTDGEVSNTVANEHSSSRLQDTLHTQVDFMDPIVGNQNSIQAIKSPFPAPEKRTPSTLEPDDTLADATVPQGLDLIPLIPFLHGQCILTDKMAASMEKHLYSEYRTAECGPLGPGRGQRVVSVSQVSPPPPMSPV